jgi:hypothetical protein
MGGLLVAIKPTGKAYHRWLCQFHSKINHYLEPTVYTVVFQLHIDVNQFWCVWKKTRLRELDLAGIDLMYS